MPETWKCNCDRDREFTSYELAAQHMHLNNGQGGLHSIGPVTDTEEQFREKDRAYFDLFGRNVAIGNKVGMITEYQPIAGPRYLFKVQIDGEEVPAYRESFYVLPSPEELRETIATTAVEGTYVKEFCDPEDIDAIAHSVHLFVIEERL